MNLRVVVISAACLLICIAPASSTSLLAAVKGAIVGAGLTALKSGIGSETVVIQSEPGSVAEVLPASQITVQDLHRPVQTITYTSNPISRLWGAVSNAISAKAKAVGEFLQPNPVVIVVPEKPTTQKPPVFTIDLGQKPLPNIDIELANKPIVLPGIDIELGNKPLVLPGIDIALGNMPLGLPSIDIALGNKPLALPGIDIALRNEPLVLPSIGVSASVGRNTMFRRVEPLPVIIDYLKK